MEDDGWGEVCRGPSRVVREAFGLEERKEFEPARTVDSSTPVGDGLSTLAIGGFKGVTLEDEGRYGHGRSL